MLKVRNLGLLLALSSVAVLPACSWFGGDNDSSRTSSAAPSSSYTPPPPPPQQAEAQQAVTPDTIRQVQQTLQQQKMYRGQVDGVWGPRTQTAVRQYQQKNNLGSSGQLDQQTLASLNIGGGQNYGDNGQPPNTQASGNMPPPDQQNAQSNQRSGGTTTR